MTEHSDEEPTGRSDSAGTPVEPEVWRLVHPRHGAIEVAVGGPEQLRTVDPGFPRAKKTVDSAGAPPEGEELPAEAVTNPGFVLLKNGDVVARAHQVGNHRVSITADPPEPGKFTTDLKALSGPRVQMRSSAFATAVRQVTFREGGEVVHFDPPPGSEAEARLASIAASPWKRVAYPVAAGVGRSGWAIAVILLLPILGRLISPVIDWIAERMPDIDIPWPDISLPNIPWPNINLPSINLPEVNLPGWVEFLLEYSKVWVPLLIGVALAVVAVRHSRKSRRIRRQWEAERANENRAEREDGEGHAEREDRAGREDGEGHAGHDDGEGHAGRDGGEGHAERDGEE